jgi:alkylation response protein AidB-like acyl-CoA dehydrogenase
VKVDGGHQVTGRKIFCSAAPAGALMLTTAIADEAAGPTVLHMAVPMNAPGVKLEDTWRTLGMRGTGSHDVTLESVFVPDAAVSARRPSGKWHPAVHLVVMVALPLLNAVYVGIAEAARELALEGARKRRDDRIVQLLAGEMENEVSAAQLALTRMLDLATTAQPGEQTSIESMACRALLGRATRAAVDKAMELAGGSSFYRAARLERLFRDVQAVRFHPMQDKPQTLLQGRAALGLPWDD